MAQSIRLLVDDELDLERPGIWLYVIAERWMGLRGVHRGRAY